MPNNWLQRTAFSSAAEPKKLAVLKRNMMKFDLEPYYRNIPNKDLLNDLARVAREIGKDKVTIDEYNERGRFHNTTLTRRFGSWFTALEKAGLKKTRNLNIPNEELFNNLYQFAFEH